jgi:hypothetical protein
MKRFFLSILLITAGLSISVAQVGINADGSNPDGSAMVDIKSTTKGALIPRMTSEQITGISLPADGLMVYCTSDSKIYIYNSSIGQWKEVAYGSSTIIPTFTCGISLTVNHNVSGGVAPVVKTVTYETVTNIPGETSKCWITRNLGASQQATEVSDATEASAGWYWQFNRKQGYKHDGTTLTPSWTITSINENMNWQSINDPCALEIGTGWRIPTYTEWYNVDNHGGWYDWDGPYGSNLKMHVAGYLEYNDGSLSHRGSYGYYWSSTQQSGISGRELYFDSDYCRMDDYEKVFGFTLRCLRE